MDDREAGRGEREGRFTAIHFAVKPPRRFVRYIYASKSRFPAAVADNYSHVV